MVKNFLCVLIFSFLCFFNAIQTFENKAKIYDVPLRGKTDSYILPLISNFESAAQNEILQRIGVNSLPEVDFGRPISVCLEVPAIKFIAAGLNEISGTGVFSGIGVNSRGVFKPAKAGIGTYTIKYKFKNTIGETVEQTQTVTVNETPIVNAGEDRTVVKGSQFTLAASALGSGLTYKWSPSRELSRDDVLNPTVSLTEDMVYTLTVTSASGCIATDQVSVKYLKNLIIPTAFTPNGDGVNDVWNIQYIDNYPEVKVEVYDRTGQRIFFSNGYRQPFDGMYNGKNVPVGVYYYIINLSTRKKPLTGALTIIR